MQEEHRKLIQNNFSSLVEQTDLDSIVSLLYEKGVFSERMIEPYKDKNRDMRMRKRDLYMDVTRRGPEAFMNLVDALTELGYWDLARELDPNSPLQPRRPMHISDRRESPEKQSNDDTYVSIRTAKKNNPKPKIPEPVITPPSVNDDNSDDLMEIPHFNVVKSTKFFEENGGETKLYRTRGRKRGALVVFNYTAFKNNIESYRKGVEVDCNRLKYLFSEFGFYPRSFSNLTKRETLEALKSVREGLVGMECVFVVVSSHGYERPGGSDAEFRCSDGGLISYLELVHFFNNKNCSALRGIPKVFIFQMCRGSQIDYDWVTTSRDGRVYDGARPVSDTEDNGALDSNGNSDRLHDNGDRDQYQYGHGDRLDAARDLSPSPMPDKQQGRIASDILIAHSTLPGYVSNRDGKKGSWYIQTLCEVFAEYAHNTDVLELFSLVDRRLEERFRIQTSSIDRWGFNNLLYLHPGLFEN